MPQMPQPAHAIRRTIFRNTFFQLIGRAVSALSTVCVTIVIARSFGAGGYGDFVKITTYTAFFYLIADFGLNAIYLQRSPPLRDTYPGVDVHWAHLMGLRVALSSFLVICATGIVFLLPDGGTQGYTDAVRIGILLFIPTIFLQALINSYNAVFQKHLRYDKAALSLSFGSAASVSMLMLSLSGVIPFTMATVILSLLFGSAVTSLAGLFYTRKYIKNTHILPDISGYRSLFAAGIPLGLTLLFNVVYFHVDSIILTLTRSTAEVGIYGLAYKVFELPLVFPTFFMNSLYPILLSVQHQNDTESRKSVAGLVRKSSIVLVCISVLLAGIFWFLAPLLVYIKTDFTASVPVLRILSLGLPFFFLSGLTMWILISRKQQKILMYIYGISMVINILLNILFVPKYGYIAASWITVISEAFVLACTSGAVWRNVYSANKTSDTRV